MVNYHTMMKLLSEEKKILNDPVATRKKKAFDIYLSGNARPLNKDGLEFKVKASKEGFYNVVLCPDLKLGSCSCPDYAYNVLECKHITASRYMRHEMGFTNY